MPSNGVESPGDSGCDSNGVSPTSHNVPTLSTFCDSTPSEIFAKLQDTYEKLLENVDESAGEDGLRMKVATLQRWVKDLGEQNMILVETAEQLEKEATERVALLEERIRQTSQAALKYMTKLEEYDSHVQDMADQKINLVSMSLSQEQLQTRVSNLQNDITNLMELMRRASVTGSWALDGLRFKETSLDDSFLNLIAELRPRGTAVPEKQTENGGNFPVDTCYQAEETKTLECGCKIKVFQECASTKESEMCSLKRKFKEVDGILLSTLKENENLSNLLETRKKQLMLNDKEIELLKKSLLDIEKSYKDERAALTAEVAEKHDEIRALNEKNKQLEKRFWDANMQTQLKDDIIKQMRKDIKQLKSENTGRSAAPLIPTNDHIEYSKNLPKLSNNMQTTGKCIEFPEVSHLYSKNSYRKIRNLENLPDRDIIRKPHHYSKVRNKLTSDHKSATIKGAVVKMCIDSLKDFDLCNSCKWLIIQNLVKQ